MDTQYFVLKLHLFDDYVVITANQIDGYESLKGVIRKIKKASMLSVINPATCSFKGRLFECDIVAIKGKIGKLFHKLIPFLIQAHEEMLNRLD